MCGIGGILRTDGQPIPEAWLDAIDARIAYRGPDGHGRFRDRVEVADPNAPGGKRIVEVAFVHRRLSIIDHKDGAQPMVSERGRNDKEGLVAVVFNGCIYNHRELRKELEAKGHTFVTDHSDTEVLIHGWREWGYEMPAHLDGMFAFAVWDRMSRSLVIARDWFGEKPMYRCESGQSSQVPAVFAFASERSSLCAVQDTPTQPFSVARYLLLGYPSLAEELSPRSGEIIGESTPAFFDSEKAYWNLESNHRPASLEDAIDRAVASRLEADVPLGCFLSGGVDSSLIAYYAKRHKPDLMTFSVRMADPRYDESRFAEVAATHLGTDHATLDVACEPAKDLLDLVQTLGLPFGDSSILPTYWVSKAARCRVKVAISGDGGDELFIGYERYMAARTLANHWFWLRLLPTSFLFRSHVKSRRHKLARLIRMSRDYRELGLLAMTSLFGIDDIRDLCDGGADGLTALGAGQDAVRSLRGFDVDHYLPGDLLRKVDTASMACGLEVRCPFLDRDLANAALSMPIEKLMPGGQRKGLLRQIARKYLPREIVDRPKMGFAIPIGEWFRNDDLPHKGSGMKTLLLDHLNSAEPFGPIQLNRKAVQRFIDEHMSGKRDHGQRLFTLLTLSIWAKQTDKSRNA